jgi:hypothetical protein
MAPFRGEYRGFAAPQNFARLLEPIPKKVQQEVADLYRFDWHARKVHFQPYFRAWVLALLTRVGGLRDWQAEVSGDVLYQALGAHLDVSVGGLSQANAQRPDEPFEELLEGVLKWLGRRARRDPLLSLWTEEISPTLAALLEQATIFDSTTFSLPSTAAAWAHYSSTQAGVRLHVRLGAGGTVLDRLIMTTAKAHDGRFFKDFLDLGESPGQVYLFDAGYTDLRTFDEIVDAGDHFVTTLSGTVSYEIVSQCTPPEGVLPCGYTVQADLIVRLGSPKEYQTQHLFRLLLATDTQGQAVKILSDMLEATCDELCSLHKFRWQVEIFFRWLKQLLGLKRLFSYTPGGIHKQIYVALILYALLLVYHQSVHPSVGWLTDLLRQVRAELHADLYAAGYEQGAADVWTLLGDLSPPLAPLMAWWWLLAFVEVSRQK